MKKNRYRIVFNKTRNLMMAVAENTTSYCKDQLSGSAVSWRDARRFTSVRCRPSMSGYAFKGAYYDVFAGGVFYKPQGFTTSDVATGFSLSYQF